MSPSVTSSKWPGYGPACISSLKIILEGFSNVQPFARCSKSKAPLDEFYLKVHRCYVLNGSGFFKPEEVCCLLYVTVCYASGSLACIAFQHQPFEMQASIATTWHKKILKMSFLWCWLNGDIIATKSEMQFRTREQWTVYGISSGAGKLDFEFSNVWVHFTWLLSNRLL